MMWKDIDGYEGIYQISDRGEVLCLERYVKKSNGVIQMRKERYARLFKDKDGYVNVKLNKNGVSKIYKVHRLVAIAFVDGYSKNKEVNHIDFNKENNSAKNLEWVDHRENIKHSASNGRYKRKYGTDNPNYGNNTLKEKYKNNPELSILQSCPGEKNGRCVPVTVVFENSETYFAYLSLCAKELIKKGVTESTNVSYVSSKISNAAKNGILYLNRRFYI